MWQWNNDWIVQERQKDLLREVERQQLLHMLPAQRQGTSRYYGPLLVWLGRQFVTWGAQIQERYTPIELRCESGDA